MERLQKYIASCGITSRRKAEELIINGHVKVNGITINELGTKIDPGKDIVTVSGKRITEKNDFVYIKLNKPTGYVTTVKDQFGRKTVLDLIDIKERIYPIGRLDFNTSGLLLLTDDGELANKLMHPKYHIYKTYSATVKGQVGEGSLQKLRTGVHIEDYTTSPAKVKLIEFKNNKSVVLISIYEGRNRQVRKMMDAVGHPVLSLNRISFGEIDLSNLKTGEWAYLSNDEINFLKKEK
ncbi:rRNA pseudouridine synthase [Sedimentibacter hydroxybenzoicus DSM 7310]|uniref:Pseudouridine synthase n=1 Tax=Sedimentibacter hydroxybenzoicus DSM 7310 TaxID=1123245 RepID=A0A974GVN2_SEDHY|nr:pseudouridine synthase [Sedimentibacter hydroxybenzoicus]NYB73539.1 rRNA pseudouridine synthase [Sedimentibacter hydroxybenzoicus DSM 7310]